MAIKVRGLETYYGGKGASGTFQKIINHIPKHDIYIEPFLGSGAIMRNKLPAKLNNIGIDLDRKVIYLWNIAITENKLTSFNMMCGDGLGYLKKLQNGEYFFNENISVFIYCDPPYLMDTRSCQKEQYTFEMFKPGHVELLETITGLQNYMVAISCYENDLYKEYLSSWNNITFQSQSRHGPRTEFLYMNYPPPQELHDYSYVGEDFRERERIRKKIIRHVSRLKKLPLLEREAILNAIKQELI